VARHSAETACTLLQIGLVLQGIAFLVLLGLGLFFLFAPFVAEIVLFLAFLSFVWLLVVYVFSYARTRDGDYEGARTPTLVFGVLSLVTGGIVSGILFIVAYVEIGAAIDEVEARRVARHAPPTTPTYSPSASQPHSPATSTPLLPSTSAPSTSPGASGSSFCPNCGRPTASQARYCRNCGALLQ
jgi:hypothetical protein